MNKWVIATLLTGVVVGCTAPHNENAQSSSQVVARVNGDEITVHQLNSELQKISLPNANDIDTSKKIVSGLIDRQLLVQESLKLNLDRTPEVVEAVVSAKAQIYAQAYLSRKLAKLTAPTAEDIQQIINEHPDAFAHRKIFSCIDLVFNNDATKVNLEDLEAKATTLDKLRSELALRGVEFTTQSSKFSTDALPFEVLQKVRNAKAGDLLFAHDREKIIVKSVSEIVEVPMPNEQSIQIATKLAYQKKQQAFIQSEISRLKHLSKVEILDKTLEFGHEDRFHDKETHTKPGTQE